MPAAQNLSTISDGRACSAEVDTRQALLRFGAWCEILVTSDRFVATSAADQLSSAAAQVENARGKPFNPNQEFLSKALHIS